jgi:hypothetical protein
MVNKYMYIHSTDPVSASIASEYEHVNKHRRHKTRRKTDSQDKTVKQNKTNTFTRVNQSITAGHHSQCNNYMYKACSTDI